MFFGWTEILLIGGLLALVFWKGPGRISTIMKDVGDGIRAFRTGIKDEPEPAPPPPAQPAPPQQTVLPPPQPVASPAPTKAHTPNP